MNYENYYQDYILIFLLKQKSLDLKPLKGELEEGLNPSAGKVFHQQNIQ